MPKIPKPSGSWKTTFSGILSLSLSAFAIYSNPHSLSIPETAAPILAGISTGIGLILAKDAGSIASKMPTAEEVSTGIEMGKHIKELINKRRAGSN